MHHINQNGSKKGQIPFTRVISNGSNLVRTKKMGKKEIPYSNLKKNQAIEINLVLKLIVSLNYIFNYFNCTHVSFHIL